MCTCKNFVGWECGCRCGRDSVVLELPVDHLCLLENVGIQCVMQAGLSVMHAVWEDSRKWFEVFLLERCFCQYVRDSYL